jgi:FtsZ-binding cell division protein ZapB
MAVYFIEGQGRLIKIGYSAGVRKRYKAIQTAHPGCRLLGYRDGTVSEERALHKQFEAFRVQGEWYAPCLELYNLILESAVGSLHIKERAPIAAHIRLRIREWVPVDPTDYIEMKRIVVGEDTKQMVTTIEILRSQLKKLREELRQEQSEHDKLKRDHQFTRRENMRLQQELDAAHKRAASTQFPTVTELAKAS